MSGKRAFLEILKQEGVEVVFGNPGTTELALMDAFAVENDIRYVLGLQEAVVMAMADGYAQASGKLAVVNLHVTPGLGNAMGMLYDAQKAGSPILVTAGQHDQDFNRTEPILYADLPPIARPLVKWSDEVHRIEDLPLMVAGVDQDGVEHHDRGDGEGIEEGQHLVAVGPAVDTVLMLDDGDVELVQLRHRPAPACGRAPEQVVHDLGRGARLELVDEAHDAEVL